MMPLIHLFKKKKKKKKKKILEYCQLINLQSSKLSKRFIKNIALAYIYQVAKFGDSMSCGSKDIFKNASCLMY